MEVIEHTANKLTLREEGRMLEISGVGLLVIAVVVSLCVGILTSGSGSSLIALPLVFSLSVMPGVFLLLKWHRRATCIFDKLSGMFTMRRSTKLCLNTVEHPLEEIQRVEVIVPSEFQGEPVRELALFLASGHCVKLSDSTLAAPIQLGATAILLNHFLGLSGQKRDLVAASLGRRVE